MITAITEGHVTNPGLTLKMSDVACMTELSKGQTWSKDRYSDSMLNIMT